MRGCLSPALKPRLSAVIRNAAHVHFKKQNSRDHLDGTPGNLTELFVRIEVNNP
ncbi:MAG: hypothetical protein Q7R22_004840 [Verrucomicrobiota bacterium JB025]|nr:hypothetical protein [Verrucomicrobiota bacterium JB025]